MRSSFGYLDTPPLAFAHRGGGEHVTCSPSEWDQASAFGDENTAEAIARAIALGYRYVETDVRATADGVAVVFHDADLQRLAGRPERLKGLRWADLATIRMGGAAAVPRLDDVLAAWPQVRFNIDVKSDAAVAPTLRAVRETGAGRRVLLASFSDARLARLRIGAGPAVATSLGRRGVVRLRLASLAGRKITLPPSVVAAQVPVRHAGVRVVDRRFIAYAHRLALQVHVWTVDDPAEMNELLDLGVDGIMTDQVTVLRDVYASRGHWAAGPAQ